MGMGGNQEGDLTPALLLETTQLDFFALNYYFIPFLPLLLDSEIKINFITLLLRREQQQAR